MRASLGLPRRRAVVTALGLVPLLFGCTNENAVIGTGMVTLPPGGQISLSRDVQPIFDLNCAVGGCHDGITRIQQMSLAEADIFDPTFGIVGVASTESPLKRVEPGDSSSSYLVHKLEGTQVAAGGGGDQMPQGAAPLSGPEIQLIRDWIDQGANDN